MQGILKNEPLVISWPVEAATAPNLPADQG